MELGVPARLRPEPEGRAVGRGFGRTHPSFCEAFDARIEEDADGLGGVRSSPAITAGNGRVVATTNGRRQRRASRQRRQASGVGHAPARTPSAGRGTSPERRRRAAVGEEETRAMLGAAGGGPSTGGRMGRRGIRGGFSWLAEEGSFCCWRRGEATATLRRSGDDDGGKRTGADPTFGTPFKNHLRCRCLPPVQQVSYVAGLHGLVFQPFAVQQQRLPQTEYPLDGQQQRQLRRPGPYQEQQQQTSSATSTATRNNISERKSAWRFDTASLQSRMEEEPKELPFEESRSEEAAMESARRRKVLEFERERPVRFCVLGKDGAVYGFYLLINVDISVVFRRRQHGHFDTLHKRRSSYYCELTRNTPASALPLALKGRIFEVRFFAWCGRACARGGAGTTQKEDPGYVISLRSGKKTPITVRAGSDRITISRSPRRGLTKLAIDGAQHSHDEVRSENHTHKRAPDAGAKAQLERIIAPEARTTLTRCSRQSKLGTCHRWQKREPHSQDGTRQRVLKKMSNSGGDASNNFRSNFWIFQRNGHIQKSKSRSIVNEEFHDHQGFAIRSKFVPASLKTFHDDQSTRRYSQFKKRAGFIQPLFQSLCEVTLTGENEASQISAIIQKYIDLVYQKIRHSPLKRRPTQLVHGIYLNPNLQSHSSVEARFCYDCLFQSQCESAFPRGTRLHQRLQQHQQQQGRQRIYSNIVEDYK
ncbi:unnamed protein product [Trichogramma brassicae]|uniref:Uncharacterized protein n=1 Tax=Trichogramma brassicae TaxID=86971 RepID=A0A6H5IR54_9HYME|nr:unnamed protein product [Trichogramma brassicae]